MWCSCAQLPWLLSPAHAQQGWIPSDICGIPRRALRCTSYGCSARFLPSLLRSRRHSHWICQNENGCRGRSILPLLSNTSTFTNVFTINSVFLCFATLTHLSTWFLYYVGYLSTSFDWKCCMYKVCSNLTQEIVACLCLSRFQQVSIARNQKFRLVKSRATFSQTNAKNRLLIRLLSTKIRFFFENNPLWGDFAC